MRKLLFFFVALLTIVAATPGITAQTKKRSIMELPPFERAVLIIKKFETLHKPKHWPYVGYGHQVQPGEPYRRGVQLSERQADALLRKDLRKFVALYDDFRPNDALLLGVLAYNCGPGVVNKSSVYRRLKSGNRDIFKSYTSHCRYKGKFHKQLHQRRIMEFMVLFQK
jgi:GH24 family phage-related lysozyme (muramidase)